MIFENLEQIRDLIDKPANKVLPMMVSYHSKLNMLVNGVGVGVYLEKIEGYENKAQKDLRTKVAMSTKHIFTAVLRPFDKIFTARGGSANYGLSPNQEAGFNSILKDISGGQSFKDWMRNVWMNKYITDPNGLVYFEVSDDWTYPTYKSITSIHDYKVDGTQPEYIIFKSHKEDEKGQYYRVVDDLFDRTVLVNGGNITEVEEETYINYWGYVPALTCSDIPDPNFNMKISPIDGVVELAMEYLRDMSIHTITKFLFGYPVFWRYVEDCAVCHGTKAVDGKVCPSCQGTGKKLTKDVTDIIGLEFPLEGEPSIIPPAGFVVSDLGTWQEQREELKWLYAAIHFAVWGTHTREEATNESATGRFIDTQPVNDRLNGVTDTAERTTNNSIDIIGEFHYTIWEGSGVSLGRRYQIEPPDVLMVKYTEARSKGLPDHTLTYLLTQYYQTEFATQQMQLMKITKLMKVEPFIHLTAKELAKMQVPREDFLGKIYFAEWSGTLSEEQVMFEDTAKLKINLNNYTKTKDNGTLDTGE